MVLSLVWPPLSAASCEGPHVPIADIQGRGSVSPMVDRRVVVQGIVTVDLRHPGGFGGFYMQQARSLQDSDDQTSEGVFVHTQATAGTPGDRVVVRGKVTEHYGLTSLTGVPRVVVCNRPGLPEPVAIDPAALAADDREAMEGMLVTTSEPLTITDTWNLGRYGEVVLAPGLQWMPTQLMPPGPAAMARQAQQDSQRLVLDDGLGRKYPRPVPYLSDRDAGGEQPTLRVGDRIGPVTGILDYRFGQWRLQPQSPPLIQATNPRAMPPARHPLANIRVASLNLGNLFNGDGRGNGFPTERGATTEADYRRQLARLASQIQAMDADILALSELENDGYGDHSAAMDLAGALGAPWRVVTAATDQHGDAIRNGLFYRVDRVQPQAPAMLMDDGAFARWHRPAIAQAFAPKGGGEAVTVVAVHLKSKSCRNAPSAQQAADDGQGCFAPARLAAAKQLGHWQPAGTDSAALALLTGDFNAYAMETPLQALARGGYADLVARFHGREHQTFRYHGRQGTLDYHLANQALVDRVLATHIWSVNAEEPRLWAYDATKAPAVPSGFLWRASDHNPVITDLRLKQTD